MEPAEFHQRLIAFLQESVDMLTAAEAISPEAKQEAVQLFAERMAEFFPVDQDEV